MVGDFHQALPIRPKYFMPILHILSKVISCKVMAKRGNRRHKTERSGSRRRAEQIRAY